MAGVPRGRARGGRLLNWFPGFRICLYCNRVSRRHFIRLTYHAYKFENVKNYTNYIDEVMREVTGLVPKENLPSNDDLNNATLNKLYNTIPSYIETYKDIGVKSTWAHALKVAWLIEMGAHAQSCLGDWNGRTRSKLLGWLKWAPAVKVRGLVIFLLLLVAAKSWWKIDPLAVIQKVKCFWICLKFSLIHKKN